MRGTPEPKDVFNAPQKQTPPQPQAATETWRPYTDRNGSIRKGIEVSSSGKLRTNLPLPKP